MTKKKFPRTVVKGPAIFPERRACHDERGVDLDNLVLEPVREGQNCRPDEDDQHRDVRRVQAKSLFSCVP